MKFVPLINIILKRKSFTEKLSEYFTQKLTLNFENALFLSAKWKILATVWEKINM